MIDALLISSSPIFGLTGFVNVHTITIMEITFDAGKDAINVAKHGTSLALAMKMDWSFALIWSDTRHAYGEARQAALVLYEGRVYFVAFVDRPDGRRIISLRKANIREVKTYAQND